MYSMFVPIGFLQGSELSLPGFLQGPELLGLDLESLYHL